MKTPTNLFKQGLLQGRAQVGLWLDLADGLSAELLAGIGYDWLVIDGEHGPNDLRSVLEQLRAIASAQASLAGLSTQPIVRLPIGETSLIKQYLDLGAQTLLIPMVNTPEQAKQMASAVRYPPVGVRGVGSLVARSSRWQAYPDYLDEANEQVCLLATAETTEALENIEGIASTPGVDGVFIGPYDLSVSMGYPGQTEHPAVQAAIETAVKSILKAGKAPGILAMNEAQACKWIDLGVLFVGLGVDTIMLTSAARELLKLYKSGV